MTDSLENIPQHPTVAHRKEQLAHDVNALYYQSFERMQERPLHPGLLGKPLELLVYRSIKRRVEQSRPASSALEVTPIRPLDSRDETGEGMLISNGDLLPAVKALDLTYSFEPQVGVFKDLINPSVDTSSHHTLSLALTHVSKGLEVIARSDTDIYAFETPESIDARKKTDTLGYFEPLHVTDLPLNGYEPRPFLERHQKMLYVVSTWADTRVPSDGFTEKDLQHLEKINRALTRTEEILDSIK